MCKGEVYKFLSFFFFPSKFKYFGEHPCLILYFNKNFIYLWKKEDIHMQYKLVVMISKSLFKLTFNLLLTFGLILLFRLKNNFFILFKHSKTD